MGRAVSYTKSERLEKVARINTELRISEERLRDLRDNMQRLHSIQYGDRVQRSGSIDRLADGFAMIEDIENRIMGKVAELEKEKQALLEEIQRIKRPEYVEILYLRYVALLSLKETAVKMHYSDRHIKRLHKEALEAFERLTVS